jgi:hypothetical protein
LNHEHGGSTARTGPHKDLHAFLHERLPTFDWKRAPRLDATELTSLIRVAASSAADADWDGAERALGLMESYAAVLALPRHAGHAPHLANLRSAVAKRSKHLCLVHSTRLLRVIQPAATDVPLRDNERVSVTRTEHGWFDGRLMATVVAGSGGSLVKDDEGIVHEIRHRRDVRKVTA